MRYRHANGLDLSSSGPSGSCERDKFFTRLYHISRNKLQNKALRVFLGSVLFFSLLALSFHSSSESSLNAYPKTGDTLHLSTWNIAAINNNPFEYWITYDNPTYKNLMQKVQNYINDPGESELVVSAVFTPKMFKELAQLMNLKGWEGVAAVKKIWRSDYSKRRIISDFLKDSALGKKRLTSMPDRVTNTISTMKKQYYRPTVINCYDMEFKSFEDFWEQWKQFVFKTEIDGVYVSDMLHKIPKAKYDAITIEEEAISIPLQTLAIAVFDSILVHMMMELQRSNWQKLRTQMCHSLNLKKNAGIIEILEQSYSVQDVFFLQEVAPTFIKEAASSRVLSSNYHIMKPQIPSKNHQNSVIFLNKNTFDVAKAEDVTSKLKIENPKMVAAGDILCIVTEKYFLASFHGDTNGMATIPVTRAVNNLKSTYPHLNLLFGLDANTYEHAVSGKTQSVLEFAEEYRNLGLSSCWGDIPDPRNHTTCNARTYLQPQLNKAAKRDEIEKKGDVNPKDFILFEKPKYRVVTTIKDNTGERKYIEKLDSSDTSELYVFPTLDFPSDHGILTTVLAPV